MPPLGVSKLTPVFTVFASDSENGSRDVRQFW
jgi:hypothetical protein